LTTEVNYVTVRRFVFYPALRLEETKPKLCSLKTGGAPTFHQQTLLLSVAYQSNLDVWSLFIANFAFPFSIHSSVLNVTTKWSRALCQICFSMANLKRGFLNFLDMLVGLLNFIRN